MTIKASELRIGNWVNYKTEPFMIRGVVLKYIIDDDKYDCVYEDKYAGYSIDEINPIPLTIETLESCGFVKSKSVHGYYYKAGIKISGHANRWIYKGLRIFSIHQLQNLYFALTGIELSVNIETSIQHEKS